MFWMITLLQLASSSTATFSCSDASSV